MTLDAGAFCRVYAELNDVKPFPWQVDLVDQVLTTRSWPSLVDVPTGMGKTAMIDIAVFVAAATAGERDAHRPGRRRVMLVVDRRIVVDEAYERAWKLSRALGRAVEGELDSAAREVALALRSLAPTAGDPVSVPVRPPGYRTRPPVLSVTRMRGGVTWDAAWLERPDLPAVVVGTVDQLGSRLLFRGYGVSDRRKPIDAALVGTDSLVLVDEAHLAQVMVTTLTEAQVRDGPRLGVPQAAVVQLTATPSATTGSVYAFDLDAHRHHEEAWRRLSADKRLSVVAADPKSVVAELAGTARSLVGGGADTALVVCNTVGRAREVHALLAAMTTARRDPLVADVELLIGRSRPADRDVLVEALRRRFGLGRRDRGALRPAILVATQTVEVGANLDVEALVTESAPWDALVQRLGRLNRLGRIAGTRAVVVHDGADDAVYGAPRTVTWSVLERLSQEAGSAVDVSPMACRELALDMPADAVAIRPAAPLLLSPTLDAWARTGPVPLPDAPVAPYLHGLDRQPATVSVAWREGMVEADPVAGDTEVGDDEIDTDLRALPVLPAEIVELPMHAVRSWLQGEAVPAVSDLEDVEPLSGGKLRSLRDPFRAVAWRSDAERPAAGAWRWVTAQELRPGDILVIPVERGGLDLYGWAPESISTVVDVADSVRFSSSGEAPRRRLRADAATPRRLCLAAEDARAWQRRLSALQADDIDNADAGEVAPLGDWLVEALERTLGEHAGAPPGCRLPGSAWTAEGLASLMAWVSSGVGLTALGERWGVAEDGLGYRHRPGEGRFLMTATAHSSLEIERDDELVECSSMGAERVPLRIHHRNVGDRARDIARAIGLAPEVAAAVEAAATWHDLGKLEQRFQAMLCGGDRLEAMLADEPLAKSGIDPNDRAAWRASRVRSGLPAGLRHEAWSSVIVQAYFAESPAQDVDPDLVIHLVASHHGHARPWLPPVPDDQPTAITAEVDGTPVGGLTKKVTVRTDRTVDLAHPLRFAGLNARYGRWGLALLETIVRCSDMTVSAEGS